MLWEPFPAALLVPLLEASMLLQQLFAFIASFTFVMILLNLCGLLCANWFPGTSHICVSYSLERCAYVELAIVINRVGVYSSSISMQIFCIENFGALSFS